MMRWEILILQPQDRFSDVINALFGLSSAELKPMYWIGYPLPVEIFAELCTAYLHNTRVKLSATIYRSESWNHLAYWHLFFLIIRFLPYSSLIVSGFPSWYNVLQKFNIGRCLPTVPYLLQYLFYTAIPCVSLFFPRYVSIFFVFWWRPYILIYHLCCPTLLYLPLIPTHTFLPTIPDHTLAYLLVMLCDYIKW